MKMIKLIVALFVLCSAGCALNEADYDSDTYLRIKNDTGSVIADLTIDNVYYGNLQSAEMSEYKEINPLWETPRIVITIEGERKHYLPTDHLGENPLPPGRYTASLILHDQDGNQIPVININ